MKASYPAELVARIKGALRSGLRPKQLASITRIPVDTIKEWSADAVRCSVDADEAVADDIRQAVMGKFLGRPSES